MVPAERTVTIARRPRQEGRARTSTPGCAATRLRTGQSTERRRVRHAAPADLQRRRPARSSPSSPLGQRTGGFGEVRRRPDRAGGHATKRSAACPAATASSATVLAAPAPRKRSIKLGPGHGYRLDYDRCTGCAVVLRAMPVPRDRDDPGGRHDACHDRRQHGRRPRRLPRQRGLRDLSDHAVLDDGRARRRVGRAGLPNIWGDRPGRPGDAERGRARPARCTARCSRAR